MRAGTPPKSSATAPRGSAAGSNASAATNANMGRAASHSATPPWPLDPAEVLLSPMQLCSCHKGVCLAPKRIMRCSAMESCALDATSMRAVISPNTRTTLFCEQRGKMARWRSQRSCLQTHPPDRFLGHCRWLICATTTPCSCGNYASAAWVTQWA